ncbi:unnamed protein product [Spirodela intermedia]|uniref:Uncharacterized protein n=1 Tax=Spirodela intermedia TaxID=51605 RepID=A0A7I8KXU2_SPIIN|nr:unnamed protein product [Spirodela intermedia]
MLWRKRVHHSLVSHCFRSCCIPTAGDLPRWLRFSSSTGAGEAPLAAVTPFLVEYLVDSCGFSPAEAAKVSSSLPRVETLEKPVAAVQFLRHKGFSEDDVRSVILGFPILLRREVAKTLEPRIRFLQEEGFSIPEISRLVSANPSSLRVSNLGEKIEFWRKLMGTNERALKVLSESHVLNASLDRKIKPNVSFLRETGLAEHRIARILSRRPRLVTCRLETIQSLIDQVKNHGIAITTGMFEQALYALANVSKAKFEEKLKLFQSFGWSEKDFLSAFQRSPLLLRVSERKIQQVMGFLLGEAGCEPSYVALRPVLLSYSLRKRMMPRYSVLRALRKNSIAAGENDFLGTVVLPEGKFVERYILSYSEKIPGLLEAYSMAVAEGIEREERS